MTSRPVNGDGTITRSADRAARGANHRYFRSVSGAKSDGNASNARSWMVTTPGHGRRSGRKQFGAWTSRAQRRHRVAQREGQLAHVARPAAQARRRSLRDVQHDHRWPGTLRGRTIISVAAALELL